MLKKCIQAKGDKQGIWDVDINNVYGLSVSYSDVEYTSIRRITLVMFYPIIT